MSNITPTQRELLTRAAAEPEGVLDAPVDAKLAKALIKKGLAISLPVEGGASRLIITEAGRAAVRPTDETARCGEDPAATTEAELEAPHSEGVVADASPAAGEAVGTPAAADAAREPKDGPSGKLGVLVGLLKRPEGATVEAMTAATGWQAHSVRGAMSGSLKKGFGFPISSEKTDAGRIYKITAGEGRDGGEDRRSRPGGGNSRLGGPQHRRPSRRVAAALPSRCSPFLPR